MNHDNVIDIGRRIFESGKYAPGPEPQARSDYEPEGADLLDEIDTFLARVRGKPVAA